MTIEKKIRKYFKTQVKEFRVLSKKTYMSPSVERVHELRIATRRMRSVLQFSHDRISSLNELAKALGEIRDIDVALNNMTQYHLSSKNLKKKRKSSARTLVTLLHKNIRKEREKKLKDIDKRLEDRLKKNFHLTVLKLQKKLIHWCRGIQGQDLHSLRITLKKIRYMFEATGKPLGHLKKIQDQLGRIHDLELLEKSFSKDQRVAKDRRRETDLVLKKINPIIKWTLKELKGIS